VHALRTYDYAVIRIVPRVERGEFVNAGIILSCDVERILLAAIELALLNLSVLSLAGPEIGAGAELRDTTASKTWALLILLARRTAFLNISHCSGRILSLRITVRDPFFSHALYIRMSDRAAIRIAQLQFQLPRLCAASYPRPAPLRSGEPCKPKCNLSQHLAFCSTVVIIATQAIIV